VRVGREDNPFARLIANLGLKVVAENDALLDRVLVQVRFELGHQLAQRGDVFGPVTGRVECEFNDEVPTDLVSLAASLLTSLASVMRYALAGSCKGTATRRITQSE
jgi:hypothetical protein